LIHHGLQSIGKLPAPFMDNGVRSDWDDMVLKDVQIREWEASPKQDGPVAGIEEKKAPENTEEIDC